MSFIKKHSPIVDRLNEFMKSGQVGEFCSQADKLTLRAQFTSVDSLSCAMTSMQVAFSPETSFEELRKRCDDLATQLSYLLEPILVVESDADLSAVQMRSNPPQKEGSIRRYFELSGTSSKIVLRRFEKRVGETRQSIDFILTKEVVSRLANDLLSAAQ